MGRFREIRFAFRVLPVGVMRSILILLPLASGCGMRFNTTATGRGSVISGTVFPLRGLLADRGNDLFDHGPFRTLLRTANAAVCTAASVRVDFYAVDSDGSRSASPVFTTTLDDQANFSFRNPRASPIDFSGTGIRYVIEVSGCIANAIYSRPLTSYDGQNISTGSSLVANILNLDPSKAHSLTATDPTVLSPFIARLEDLSGSSTNVGTIYTALNGDAALSGQFVQLFGFAPSALLYSTPQILSATLPSRAQERVPVSFFIAATHWNPGYSMAYIWKKDNVQVSTSQSYTWTPSGDSQGPHTISLYVGASDGAGGIDLTKPDYTEATVVTVEDTVLPEAPSFRLAGSPATNLVAARALSLEVVTGAAMANCDSFSGLALTEDDPNPPVSDAAYSLACTQAGVQAVNYTLAGSGDGAKTLRLWARDSSGTISAVPTVLNVDLDTNPPADPVLTIAAATTNLGSFPVTGTCSSDTDRVQLKIDGAVQSTVNCTGLAFSGSLTSSSDGTHVITARSIDLAGNFSVNDSSSVAWTQDTVAPSAPAATLASANPANSTAATLTIASCADRAFVAVSESSTPPAAGAAAWRACVTTAGGITYTVSSGDGAKTLYVFAEDAAGNVSPADSVALVVDQTPPILSLSSFDGGQVLSGLSAQSVSWSASDAGSGLRANSAVIEVSTNGGAAWGTLASGQTTAGPYPWTPGSAANSDAYRLRVTVSDNAGNTQTVSSAANFTVDSVAPTLTAGQMSINGGAATTSSNYVRVSLKGADDSTNITKFCLKLNTTSAPATSDACWVAVNAPSPGLTPGRGLTLTDFNYQMGFSPGTYHLYAWLMDQVGNVSSLTNGGAGTDGRDSASIAYSPAAPPVLANVLGVSSDSPASPPAAADLTIAAGHDVVIKWNASATAGFSGFPVSLYYTTNDTTYLPIAGTDVSPLPNSAGSGCTISSDYTGSYVWSGGSPSSAYFKVRVAVIDNNGMVALSTSSALNVASSLNFLAGNTDPGLGGSGTAALFYPEAASIYLPDLGSLAVASNGIVYFRDLTRGVIIVKPTDGIQKLLIPTTGASSGDGGPVSSATLRLPFKIALDYQDRLLIFDYDRIRRVDTSVTPMTITTIIGTGSSTADGVGPLSVKITAPSAALSSVGSKAIPFFALPNGDIYFQSDAYAYQTLAGGFRIRVYKESTQTVQSIVPSGAGYYNYPTTSLTGVALEGFNVRYDPVTSVISTMQTNAYQVFSGDSNWEPVNLDPSTYVSTGPHPPFAEAHGSNRVQALTGEIYAVDRPHGKIVKFDPVGNGWTTVAGNNTRGACDDGTLATSCSMDPTDVFVNRQGTVYIVDRGRIRTIDDAGKVVTLLGQTLSSGDGGNPLAARFNSISSFDEWGTGKIVIADAGEAKVREFSIGGTIQTIAGNGTAAYTPDTTTLATAQGTNIYENLINVDPATGDVLTIQPNFLKLKRSTGKWVVIAGGGGTWYSVADGLNGSSIRLGNYSSILGFDGSNILATGSVWVAPNVVDIFYKLYDLTTGKQSHLAGYAGVSSGFGADDTPTSSSGALANSSATPSIIPAHYDSTGGRWLMVKFGDKAIHALVPGGNITTLKTTAAGTTTEGVQAFAYQLKSGHDIIYYCSSSSRVLRKADVQAGTDVALTWPIASLRCSGYSMVYDSTRQSVIFSYTQNGLQGIAEYVNP